MKVEPIEIALKSFRHRQKYILNYEKVARKIKRIIKDFLKDENLKVIVFGSVVKGTFSPLSDIDVLIVTDKVEPTLEEMVKIRLKVKESFKDFAMPVEIHLTNSERFERWYRKFLDVYKEV